MSLRVSMLLLFLVVQLTGTFEPVAPAATAMTEHCSTHATEPGATAPAGEHGGHHSAQRSCSADCQMCVAGMTALTGMVLATQLVPEGNPVPRGAAGTAMPPVENPFRPPIRA